MKAITTILLMIGIPILGVVVICLLAQGTIIIDNILTKYKIYHIILATIKWIFIIIMSLLILLMFIGMIHDSYIQLYKWLFS
jgi:hypothetical protein